DGRGPAVVEDPAPLERLERLLPRGRGDAPGKRLPREVAVPERADGDAERLRPPQLARERPRGLAVERTAHEEAGADDRVGRERPPRNAVELDVDPIARTLSERRHRP